MLCKDRSYRSHVHIELSSLTFAFLVNGNVEIREVYRRNRKTIIDICVSLNKNAKAVILVV